MSDPSWLLSAFLKIFVDFGECLLETPLYKFTICIIDWKFDNLMLVGRIKSSVQIQFILMLTIYFSSCSPISALLLNETKKKEILFGFLSHIGLLCKGINSYCQNGSEIMMFRREVCSRLTAGICGRTLVSGLEGQAQGLSITPKCIRQITTSNSLLILTSGSSSVPSNKWLAHPLAFHNLSANVRSNLILLGWGINSIGRGG